MSKMRLIILELFACTFFLVKAEDCVWNRDTDFPTYPSLLMNMSTWQSILPVLEGSVRTIRIPQTSTVVIACPQTYINAFVSTSTSVVTGLCKGGKTLIVSGQNYTMEQLGCISKAQESVIKLFGKCGIKSDGDIARIGYNITGYPRYELIEICFDRTLEIANSTLHILHGASVNATDTRPNNRHPTFKKGTGFYSSKPSVCYTTKSQTEVMQTLLGNSSVINFDKQYYFAKGHLTPDADFMTIMERNATYYYINAVPQWEKYNIGNWKNLETAVRNLASSHGTDMHIYTGTSDTLQLNDIDSKPVDIYICLTDHGDVIPAPEIMWKVIYEPSTVRGVAVIGVNIPYLTSFPATLCENICNQISWITFDTTNLEKGATYCCRVEDLYRVVPNAPDLGPVGLLSN